MSLLLRVAQTRSVEVKAELALPLAMSLFAAVDYTIRLICLFKRLIAWRSICFCQNALLGFIAPYGENIVHHVGYCASAFDVELLRLLLFAFAFACMRNDVDMRAGFHAPLRAFIHECFLQSVVVFGKTALSQ